MEQLNVQIHIFTFHYVSIKSEWQDDPPEAYFVFTFHYVSIKSKARQDGRDCAENLHSTMYLLNRKQGRMEGIVQKIYIPLCIY